MENAHCIASKIMGLNSYFPQERRSFSLFLQAMKNRSLRILVTGAGGFIGSQTCLYFQDRHEVMGVDCFRTGETLHNGNARSLGHLDNLKDFTGKLLTADIRNPKTMMAISDFRPDVIFHLAAVSDTTAVAADRIEDVNVDVFERLLTLAKEQGCRLIYAGSASVYGQAPAPQQVGRHELPMNVYAKTKLAMDDLARLHFSDTAVVGLRYFNVYGPGEYHKGKTASVIVQWGLELLSGRAPRLFRGSEKMYRDFVYIADVMKCHEKAMELHSGIYQVGTGISRSFQEVADALQRQLHVYLPCTHIENPHAETYQFHTCAFRESAFADISFHTLEEGIAAYVPEIRRVYENLCHKEF